MESVIALLISIVCMGGAYFMGLTRGRLEAYDEAFDNVLKLINEVYEEELSA